MPTIKTNNAGGIRRVVTKTSSGNRRVSCSCCGETPCCMYPALQYGTLFNAADLPDFIRITINDEIGGTVIASKDGATYVYGNYGDIDDLRLGIDNFTWVFIPNADNLSSYDQPCLLNITEAEFTIEDTFEDTYDLSVDLGGGNVLTSSLNRVGQCLWLTEPSTAEVYFAGVFYNEATCKWEHHDSDDIVVIRQGAHNGPAGTYVDAVFGATVTIS